MRKIIEYIAKINNLCISKIDPRGYDKFLLSNKLNKKKELVGIEIGTYMGEHAEYLLRHEEIKFMYLIDTYISWNGKKKGDVIFSGDYATKQITESEKIAWKKMHKYPGRYEFIKKDSKSAWKDFRKESIDFIYIDGDHSYEQVEKDINNYYPLVRKGGMFGGDDFDNGIDSTFNKGVIENVIKFVNKYNLRLYVDRKDWWVIKR